MADISCKNTHFGLLIFSDNLDIECIMHSTHDKMRSLKLLSVTTLFICCHFCVSAKENLIDAKLQKLIDGSNLRYSLTKASWPIFSVSMDDKTVQTVVMLPKPVQFGNTYSYYLASFIHESSEKPTTEVMADALSLIPSLHNSWIQLEYEESQSEKVWALYSVGILPTSSDYATLKKMLEHVASTAGKFKAKHFDFPKPSQKVGMAITELNFFMLMNGMTRVDEEKTGVKDGASTTYTPKDKNGFLLLTGEGDKLIAMHVFGSVLDGDLFIDNYNKNFHLPGKFEKFKGATNKVSYSVSVDVSKERSVEQVFEEIESVFRAKRMCLSFTKAAEEHVEARKK